ncbi:2-oxoglutarate and iron-dependent oxygenase domain-containing protein [Streptomyces sp. NPDC046881]|uniref:2-oxoglutarate and iron-dependent oxygenase domain-containing protein n=1 Tax=Streptomyces sp. NPDC046881 TaxID=3155374 RepID=UPI00340131E4
MAHSTALPVVDTSRFRAPDTGRDAFLAELRSAAHEVGFFHVTGHGIPAALREGVLSVARSSGVIRVPAPNTRRAASVIGSDQWRCTLPELRDIVLRRQADALRVSREVLRAPAATLGQDEGYQWFDGEAAAHVKIVHCPPRAAEEADQGVGAYKDHGYLATQHRVVSPPSGVHRYSIPFFLGPRPDVVVEPLHLPEELVAPSRGSSTPRTTARRSTAPVRFTATAVLAGLAVTTCDFVELVIPKPRRRGVFRTHGTGRTLPHHLPLQRPSRQA